LSNKTNIFGGKKKNKVAIIKLLTDVLIDRSAIMCDHYLITTTGVSESLICTQHCMREMQPNVLLLWQSKCAFRSTYLEYRLEKQPS
jgi:hypothetical protein